jgi:sulfur-oxidizing protein SoxB
MSNGKPMEASKMYKVAGWSTVGAKSPGEPVWETVETYMKEMKHFDKRNLKVDKPDMIGIKGNPGIDPRLV